MFLAQPVYDCKIFMTLSCISFWLYRISTSTIFAVRIRAIYSSNRFAIALFIILWIFNAAMTSVVYWDLKGVQISPTDYCNYASTSNWMLLMMPLSDAIFDLAVCIAVTYRIGTLRSLDMNSGFGFWKRWLGLGRNSNTRITDRFLRDSQIYFRFVLSFFLFFHGLSKLMVALASPHV